MMYEVSAKCGHVGRGKYVDKTFAIEAESGREAAKKARWLPRVKHDHKDAINYVKAIDEIRFAEIRNANTLDPYMHCQNIQEQRMMCNLDIKKKKQKEILKREISRKNIYYKKERIRNPKSRINFYIYDRRDAI